MTQQVQEVAPGLLLGDQNSRFALKTSRIETMKSAIVRDGGVKVPLEVYPLPTPVNGALYRINDGHYRHAAALALLKEFDITLPIIIVDAPVDEIARLKHQTALNYEREGLSPIDIGLAVKRLLDAGVTRQDVRAVFSKTVGKKVLPASNSFINMMASFLEFPKDIQKKVHEGIIGVAAAYKLTTKPKDKWAEIVEQCEAERAAELEAEESRETKLEDTVRKEEERKAKEEKLAADLAAAKEALHLAAKLADEKIHAESEAMKAQRKGAADDAEKAKIAEQFKAAQTESKEAIEAAAKAKKEAEKLQAKVDNLQRLAKERAEKLAEARRAGAAKKDDDGRPAKPIGPGAIDKAAAKAGGSSVVKLTGPQMREAVREWGLPGSFDKVRAIALIVMRCFDSELTPSQAYTEMGKVTGEKVSKPKK